MAFFAGNLLYAFESIHIRRNDVIFILHHNPLVFEYDVPSIFFSKLLSNWFLCISIHDNTRLILFSIHFYHTHKDIYYAYRYNL